MAIVDWLNYQPSFKTNQTMFHRIATITSRQALQAPSIVRHGSTLRVILLQNVEGVGAAGEEHDVAAGYMRNFLYPQQIAAYRTDNNLEKYKSIMEVNRKERNALI